MQAGQRHGDLGFAVDDMASERPAIGDDMDLISEAIGDMYMTYCSNLSSSVVIWSIDIEFNSVAPSH